MQSRTRREIFASKRLGARGKRQNASRSSSIDREPGPRAAWSGAPETLATFVPDRRHCKRRKVCSGQVEGVSGMVRCNVARAFESRYALLIMSGMTQFGQSPSGNHGTAGVWSQSSHRTTSASGSPAANALIWARQRSRER